MNDYRINNCGDTAFSVEFYGGITPETNQLVRQLWGQLEKYKGSWLVDAAPSFCSALIVFDPVRIKPEKVKAKLEKICDSLCGGEVKIFEKRTFIIPVCYGEEFGEDLEEVAHINSLTPKEVVEIHSGTDYYIYMLGFLPGFPYLGGLDSRIATPRLVSPRTKIPAGSVGIGGNQTGIYPLVSPGGWRLIGKTPVRPYDAERVPAVLYNAGDYIRFVPIDKAEFERIDRLCEKGEYECAVEIKKKD
ncbi:MAG: 5-oxoprolinase subunit PxpB [Clostridia bacterium]|nr:5-oxoprolinase subunit PxpB [Clostridia bacterium]